MPDLPLTSPEADERAASDDPPRVQHAYPPPVLPAGTQTTAELDGDCWVLNGQKTFTTHGSYGDICVAMAVTDRSAAHHGISAFILEKGMPGFFSGKKENKLGLRASDTSTVIFEDCRVPVENVLGQVGKGHVVAFNTLNFGDAEIEQFHNQISIGVFSDHYIVGF